MCKPFLRKKRFLAVALVIVGLTLAYLSSGLSPALAISGDVHAHDPSMIKVGSCYYVFSTGDNNYNKGNIQIRKSCNLASGWTLIGTVFSSIPSWITTRLGSTPGNLWAPDINYFNNKYYLYYAGSTFGSNKSVIGLATATNIEGPWTDQGLVIQSTSSNNYNCIDPEIAWTITNGSRAEMWLVFGSFWDGIKMRQLNTSTGKLSTTKTTLYSLASRSGGAIEAASIAWRNGYYYLFVSFDKCCSGTSSTYNIRVGRATSITGPYYDKNGTKMTSGGGTKILGNSSNMIGPGGEDVYLDGSTYRMIYHYYDSNANGDFKMAIRDLNWSSDWPSAGSFSTSTSSSSSSSSTSTSTSSSSTSSSSTSSTSSSSTSTSSSSGWWTSSSSTSSSSTSSSSTSGWWLSW